MTIIAKFPNGHIDVYKGKRPVKAAWMITLKSTGEVLNSGHSLDPDKARKTAESNIRYAGLTTEMRFNLPRGRMTREQIAYYAPYARKLGWDGKGSLERFARDHDARVNAAARSLVDITVLDRFLADGEERTLLFLI